MHTKKAIVGLAASATTLAALVAPAAASTGDSGPATYSVTVENATYSQWLTPPNFAAHDKTAVRVFTRGAAASAGVQAVAENGGVPVLAAELESAVDGAGHGVSGVGADAPIGPGESVTFTFTSDEASLSIVSMLICTNDGFAGLDAEALPTRDGDTRRYDLAAYDAGTERNTENRGDLVPAPFCGDGGGTDQSNPALAENGVVRLHGSIRGVGDLPTSFGWCGPVARVSVTKVG